MEEVLIGNSRYEFVKDFKHNELLRKSYNALTRKIYGFDFEQYYKDGYWSSNYIPHSLLDGEKIIANVSISIGTWLVLGEKKKYIQLGTVMTDPEYRNQGLSRYLIESIIKEWENECDMIFLFANDSVLDFYPKFGFKVVSEYQYIKTVASNNEITEAEKIDMSLVQNRELLIKKINNSIVLSRLAAIKNVWLTMFYCTSFMKDNVYYIKEQDAIVIAEFQGDSLYLNEILSTAEIDLDNIINKLVNKEVKKVILGFTPNVTEGYDVNLLEEEDTTLFIMKEKAELFQNNKLMFPVLSHA